MSDGEKAEDELQELATQAWGRGAAISHDPHPEGGWKTTAWGPKGEAVDYTYGATKAESRRAMTLTLRKRVRA